jgi:hypothetical protein
LLKIRYLPNVALRAFGRNTVADHAFFLAVEGNPHVRKTHMRKTLIAMSAAAALTASAVSPALADHHHHRHGWLSTPVIGAAVGTAVGFGLYEGWFGTSNSLTGGTLASSAAGAATGGFIAGVGTVALIHAATTPCQGFSALLGASGCHNGQYVGDRIVRRR